MARRPGPARRLLARVAPSWVASPLRRALQAGFLFLFGWLFFHVARSYGSPDYSQLTRGKEAIDAGLFLMLDPLVGASAALAGRTVVWALAWGGAALALCLVLPRFFCGYACPLGTLIDLFDWVVNRPLRRLFRGEGVFGGEGVSPLRPEGILPSVASSSSSSSSSPAIQEKGGREEAEETEEARGQDARGTQGRDALATASGVAAHGHSAPATPWRHFRYFLLAGILVAAACGVLLVGYFAPIPILTRGLQFTAGLAELGVRRGWQQVPPLAPEHAVSIALFAAVLLLGLVRPRFWCRHVCPSGAMFSLVNLLGFTRRQVTADCTGCGRCVRACSFGAIDADFATRVGDCTFCQTCGGVCPTRAIRFGGRGKPSALRVAPAGGVSRRGFLCGLAAGGAAGIAASAGLRWLAPAQAEPPVRPPGSIPESDFLRRCVRCGECIRGCPSTVLQPLGLAAGLDGLWTPALAADRAGCDPSCNHCGHVCPTGAIRPLPLEAKRATRIGLAVVNPRTCLHCLGRSDCLTVARDGRPSLLCRDQCELAGYHAIDLVRLGVEIDADGQPVEGSGYLAPAVDAGKCVGCGLCQTRCYKINAKEKHLLAAAAIRVVAGKGKEDRLLRAPSRAGGDGAPARRAESGPSTGPAQTAPGGYVTDF